MDHKIVFITFILLTFCLTIIITILNINILIKIDDNKCPIDYIMKFDDQCLINLQNIIHVRTDESVHPEVRTFVYKLYKPFLMEILNNQTSDCICSENYHNEHLN